MNNAQQNTVRDALQAAIAALQVAVVAFDGGEQADQTAPAPAVKVASAKVYRSAPGKAQAKLDAAQAWTDAKAAAGVTRVKDLSAAQRAVVDAKVAAIWKAVPRTRTTKA